MKHDEEEQHCSGGDCSTTNAKNVWIAGITVTILITLFCVAMFKGGDVPLPGQPVGVAKTTAPAGQQVAFVPPACATCPTVTQCFPGAPAPSAQPVAWAPGCAQQVAWAPGCAQPAAWVPCPVPGRGSGTGAGQMGAAQNTGAIRCPQCNFVFNDANYWNRGYSRCPRCGGMIRVPVQGGNGFQQVAAVTPPPIFRDAVMLHQFRGVCENCHTVNPDIAIPASTAQVPHGFRGVCSNCHTILGLQAAP